jgi:hypothetical protein
MIKREAAVCHLQAARGQLQGLPLTESTAGPEVWKAVMHWQELHPIVENAKKCTRGRNFEMTDLENQYLTDSPQSGSTAAKPLAARDAGYC